MRKAVAKTIDSCTLEVAMAVLGGIWKLTILKHLLAETRRFGELGRLMPNITPRMLSRQLRELEEDGIVVRKVYHQVPPKVEYSVSGFARTLAPLVSDIERWGESYRTEFAAEPETGPGADPETGPAADPRTTLGTAPPAPGTAAEPAPETSKESKADKID
ncbi:winged helix-turn-helix transcriptional regulator [Saxibacter everestensis]|uniref:Winged helix-turn-helix transcriptional regulator n=1 Tax=Saxibacter everestensis TaxID=2909229 RepID=A0ABY8QSM6_9MICO|nr:winged helix-turn-helix transcriptional regulator [Brevibacteriaceae bacterium ZFBP1038]